MVAFFVPMKRIFALFCTGIFIGGFSLKAEAPFWSGSQMENEPLFFIQEEGQPTATARLLFAPVKELRIMDASRSTVYVSGKDYVWQSGSPVVTLTTQSRIPFKTHAEMFPPVLKPGESTTPPRAFGKTADGKNGVLFSEGHYFHDLQMQASYTHTELWSAAEPAVAKERLSRVMAKLQAKQPIKLVAFGDSITEGYNASGFTKAAPFQGAYPTLVAEGLQQKFGGVVTFANHAKAGTQASWGLQNIDKVISEKPDLVLLAFGMNHGHSPEAFASSMRPIIDAIHTSCPDADIVLVASMTGNPAIFPLDRFTGYRDALLVMQAPRVAVADVTTPWLELQKRKGFSSLSGNNVNHPNDFAHRVYAQVVLALFEDPSNKP